MVGAETAWICFAHDSPGHRRVSGHRPRRRGEAGTAAVRCPGREGLRERGQRALPSCDVGPAPCDSPAGGPDLVPRLRCAGLGGGGGEGGHQGAQGPGGGEEAGRGVGACWEIAEASQAHGRRNPRTLDSRQEQVAVRFQAPAPTPRGPRRKPGTFPRASCAAWHQVRTQGSPRCTPLPGDWMRDSRLLANHSPPLRPASRTALLPLEGSVPI